MTDDTGKKIINLGDYFKARGKKPQRPEYKAIIAETDRIFLEGIEDFKAYLKTCLEELNYNHALQLQNAPPEIRTKMKQLTGIFMPLLVSIQRGGWELFVAAYRDDLQQNDFKKLARIFRRAHAGGLEYLTRGTADRPDVIRKTDHAMSLALITAFKSYHVLRGKLQQAFPDLVLEPILLEHGGDMVGPAIAARVRPGLDRDIRDIIGAYLKQDQKPKTGFTPTFVK